MNSCPKCKNDNEPDAQFCTVCGTAFSSQNIQIEEDLISTSITTKKERNNQKRILVFNSIFVLLFGITNVGLWFFLDYRDTTLFLHFFGELKLFLWIVLHGKLIFGIMLTIVGIFGVLLSYPRFLVTEAVFLFFSGSWIIGNDFLAIPALAEYDHRISIEMILKNVNVLWLLIGSFEISFAIFLYIKTKKTVLEET